MDMSSIAQSLPSAAAGKSSLSAGEAASIAVFKKSVDIQASVALQLVDSIAPAPDSYPVRTLPPTIGSLFNASA